jgi:hypothetical protein
MFFRRVVPRVPTFEERLESLKRAGFEVPAGSRDGVRVSRGACAAVVRKSGTGAAEIARQGAQARWRKQRKVKVTAAKGRAAGKRGGR